MSTSITAGFSKKRHQSKQGANKHFNLAQLFLCAGGGALKTVWWYKTKSGLG
jgi:hypothetical protein